MVYSRIRKKRTVGMTERLHRLRGGGSKSKHGARRAGQRATSTAHRKRSASRAVWPRARTIMTPAFPALRTKQLWLAPACGHEGCTCHPTTLAPSRPTVSTASSCPTTAAHWPGIETSPALSKGNRSSRGEQTRPAGHTRAAQQAAARLVQHKLWPGPAPRPVVPLGISKQVPDQRGLHRQTCRDCEKRSLTSF